jgi:drug/metabolite transporter (DMT)-like permease
LKVEVDEVDTRRSASELPVMAAGDDTARRAHAKTAARLLLVGSAAAFGLMAVLARRISRGEDGFGAGQLAVVRFAIGALVSLAVFRVQAGLYRPRSYARLIARGISGAFVVVLYFWALARIPAAPAGMLYNLFPVIATLAAGTASGERPTLHLLVAVVAATAGVVLVLGRGSLHIHPGLGELSALGAACFAALSAILIRGMRSTENAQTIFFFFCVAGLPVVLPFALGPWPSAPGAWAGAVGVGLAAFAGQLLMTHAYGALSVAEAAVWLQLTPIAQMLIAVPVLGEAIEPVALLGILLTVAAVAYGTALGGPREPLPGTPP